MENKKKRTKRHPKKGFYLHPTGFTSEKYEQPVVESFTKVSNQAKREQLCNEFRSLVQPTAPLGQSELTTSAEYSISSSSSTSSTIHASATSSFASNSIDSLVSIKSATYSLKNLSNLSSYVPQKPRSTSVSYGAAPCLDPPLEQPRRRSPSNTVVLGNTCIINNSVNLSADAKLSPSAGIEADSVCCGEYGDITAIAPTGPAIAIEENDVTPECGVYGGDISLSISQEKRPTIAIGSNDEVALECGVYGEASPVTITTATPSTIDRRNNRSNAIPITLTNVSVGGSGWPSKCMGQLSPTRASEMESAAAGAPCCGEYGTYDDDEAPFAPKTAGAQTAVSLSSSFHSTSSSLPLLGASTSVSSGEEGMIDVNKLYAKNDDIPNIKFKAFTQDIDMALGQSSHYGQSWTTASPTSASASSQLSPSSASPTAPISTGKKVVTLTMNNGSGTGMSSSSSPCAIVTSAIFETGENGEEKKEEEEEEDLSYSDEWISAVKDFREAIERGNSEEDKEFRYKAFEKISSVSNNFAELAAMYSRVILTEYANEKKTIEPIKMGGIVGGSKYKIFNNILFKLPKVEVDKGLRFPSYDAAAKVSGHELKSATHLFSSIVESKIDRDCIVPLMVLIDYLGHRAIAMTVLPIGHMKPPAESVSPMTSSNSSCCPKCHQILHSELRCVYCGEYSTQQGLSSSSSNNNNNSIPPSEQCPHCGAFKYVERCTWCHLPIPEKGAAEKEAEKTTTLINGSDDGLITLHYDEKVNRVLEKVGAELNLGAHMLHGHDGVSGKFWTPFDLEVHRSSDPSDEHSRYLVDLSRLFPSAQNKKGLDYLYRLFRPELLKRSPTPISPDWTRRWQGGSTEAERAAAGALLAQLEGPGDDILPYTFADTLVGLNTKDYIDELVFRLHNAGINLRYLGLVHARLLRKHPESEWCRRVAVEMIARSLRKLINSKLRNLLRHKRATDKLVKGFIIFQLNSLFGHTAGTEETWRAINEDIATRFIRTREGEAPDGWTASIADIRGYKLGGPIFTLKISEFLGLTWYNNIWAILTDFDNPSIYDMDEPYIANSLLAISPRVKQMGIAHYAQGYYNENYLESLQKLRPVNLHVFQISIINHYKSALLRMPSSNIYLRHYGKALASYYRSIAASKEFRGKSVLSALVEKTEFIFAALEKEASDPASLFTAGDYYDSKGKTEKARALFRRAIENPAFLTGRSNACCKLADSLAFGENPDYAEAEHYYLEGLKYESSHRNRIQSHTYHSHFLYIYIFLCYALVVLNNYGVFLYKVGRVEEAGEYFFKALKSCSRVITVCGNNCALYCYYALGDEKLGKKILEVVSAHNKTINMV